MCDFCWACTLIGKSRESFQRFYCIPVIVLYKMVEMLTAKRLSQPRKECIVEIELQQCDVNFFHETPFVLAIIWNVNCL